MWHEPVLNAGARILWALGVEHDEHHEEKEAGEGEADAIDAVVARQLSAVHEARRRRNGGPAGGSRVVVGADELLRPSLKSNKETCSSVDFFWKEKKNESRLKSKPLKAFAVLPGPVEWGRRWCRERAWCRTWSGLMWSFCMMDTTDSTVHTPPYRSSRRATTKNNKSINQSIDRTKQVWSIKSIKQSTERNKYNPSANQSSNQPRETSIIHQPINQKDRTIYKNTTTHQKSPYRSVFPGMFC